MAKRKSVKKYTITKPNKRQKLMALLTAHGMKPQEIADHMGEHAQDVESIVKNPMMSDLADEYQWKIYGENPREAMRKMVPEALKTTHEIMINPSAKEGIRLNAASDILDRSLGKAKQEVEVTGSGIRDILEQLDREKKQKVIEVNNDEEISDAEIVEKDDIDEWLDENI